MTSTHVRSTPEAPAPARAGRLAVPAAAYVVAAVVLSAGVGLAAPRVAKDDVGVVALLGLAALVLGGAVALWAAWRVQRGVRRRWWALTLPALLVVAYLALWTVAQGFVAGLPAHPALGSRTPADLGLGYESVTLQTDDDLDLAAW